jgi:4-hydroxy-tetrahydrodipicolinate reductase
MHKKNLEISLVGASGKFGQSIIKAHLKAKQNCFSQLTGFSRSGQKDPQTSLQYKTLNELLPSDILIEVACPKATEHCLEFCKHFHIPYIVGSTGHSEQQLDKIKEVSSFIPIFFSQNFSIVLQLYLDMIKLIAPHTKNNCYVDLIEKHQSAKKDTPSGTAKKIAEELNMAYKLGGIEDKRNKEILQVHSIRGQDHAIEHELRFGFTYEELSIKHQVFDRTTYAQGVLSAIDFISQQKPGLYGMKDLTKKLIEKAIDENS